MIHSDLYAHNILRPYGEGEEYIKKEKEKPSEHKLSLTKNLPVDLIGPYPSSIFVYDYCSEHEWGIKKMNNKLGIDKSKGKLGIDNYTISKHDCIVFLKEENKAFLTSRKHWKKTENVTIKD